MSVVNKMLKDLENREANQAAPANYQPPEKKSTNITRLVLIVLVGVVAIGLVTFWPQSAPEQATSPAITPIYQTTTTNEVAEAAAPISADDIPDKVQDTVQTTVNDNPVIVASQAQATSTKKAQPMAKVVASEPVVQPIKAVSTPDSTQSQTQAKPVIKASQDDSKASLKEQIRLAISDNDTPTAIKLLRTLILQQPDNVGARKRLAALYFSEGRVTDAQKLLQQTVADMPEDSSVRLMYARLLVQQKDAKMAYYVLQDVDDHGQPSIELLGYRAALAQQLSLFDDALKDYASLVLLDNENAKWWLGQAVVADKQGDIMLAKNSYREALGLRQLEPGIEQFIRQRLGSLTGVSQ